MKIPAFSVSRKTRDIFVGGDEQATPRHEVPLPHDNCMSKQFVNDVVSIAILATCWHEVPMPPLEGNVINLSNPSFSSNCLGISWICVF